MIMDCVLSKRKELLKITVDSDIAVIFFHFISIKFATNLVMVNMKDIPKQIEKSVALFSKDIWYLY